MPPTVSSMMKKLEERDTADREEYTGVTLTDEYAVFKDHDVDDCFPVGDSKFGDIGEDWAENAAGPPTPDWGLTLDVNES